ncbi:KHG/KDPG aldolase [Glycine max]|nr:KHG/KDPG aldolase [Glycine max]
MGTATATLSLCQWPTSSSSSSVRMHVRFSCRTPHLSPYTVDRTLCQINNSGVIACLRANRSGHGSCKSCNSRIEDAKSAINAGAKFLMSPATVKDIMEMDYVQSGEILYIPGTMTPTEILSACDEGAKIVKIYPVSALGGFQYISALKKAFPHISMVASQGITIDSIGEYILRGASAVVLSDAIFDKDAIAQHDLDKIQKLAHSAALLGNKSVNRNT